MPRKFNVGDRVVVIGNTTTEREGRALHHVVRIGTEVTITGGPVSRLGSPHYPVNVDSDAGVYRQTIWEGHLERKGETNINQIQQIPRRV